MRLKKRLIIRLVTERNKGKSSKNLAKELGISKRRVNQVYAKYLKDGVLPVIGNGVGRPMKPVQDWETEVVREAHTQQRVGARRLEKVIEQDYRTFMGHNRIHKILLQEGLAKPNKNKQKRRKYRCYEREHSLSAVHLDWHPTKDGKHVLAVIDDASRKILAGGEFDAESVETTLAMSLQVIESVQDFACIREFITDNGSVFTCNLEGERESSQFEQFLNEQGIKHIRIRKNHPQSNGKIEKWFDTYERNRKAFHGFEAFVDWYNSVRYHEALDCRSGLRTPSEVFLRRLAPEHVFGLTKDLFGW